MFETSSQGNTQRNSAPLVSTSGLYRWVSALFAFLIWGGWAYYANGAAAENQRLASTFVQGIASLFITLFMVHAVTWLYRRIQVPYFRLVLPAVLTLSFTGSSLFTIHHFVGTPNIFYTITPALSVAFAFCLFTTYKLRKHGRERKEPDRE